MSGKAPEAKLALTTPKGTDVPFGFAPLTVNFNATGSQDFNTGSGNLTYSWDFGDGTPTATTAQVSHVYPDPKPYLVTLTVTNEWGLSDTKRTYVHVRSLASNTVFNAEYPTIQAQSLSLSPQAEAQQLLRDFPGPDLPFQTQGLQSQTLQAQATGDVEDVFPYVLAWNHNIKTGIHRITNAQGSATFGFCNSYIPYKDGTQIYPLYQYHYIDPNDPTDETFCKAMVFTSGTIGRFPAKPLRTLLISTSRGLHNIQFNVFHHLSVPRVNVSVVPDDFIAGEQGGPKVKEYHFINPQTGKDEYLVNVLVRQTEAQSGNVKFRIPVLAVNETNQFMTTVSGAFYASFPNAPTVQEPLTMVKGKAYITLNLPVNAYSATQQSIDLSTISMQGPLGCGFDTSPMGAASGARLAGCGTVSNTYEFPVSTATADVPAYPAELAKTLTLGNHVFYGDAADAAKAFKTYAQVGYVTAHTFVDFTAPYLLAPERKEDLQKLTVALAEDGKITPKEYGQLVLANIEYWASLVPQGKLVPNFSDVSRLSVSGIGIVDKAIGQTVERNKLVGKLTSESEQLLENSAGATYKALGECGSTCVKKVDQIVSDLVTASKTEKQAIEEFEAALKTIPDVGQSSKGKINSAETVIKGCKSTFYGLSIRPLNNPTGGDPEFCGGKFKFSTKYEVDFEPIRDTFANKADALQDLIQKNPQIGGFDRKPGSLPQGERYVNAINSKQVKAAIEDAFPGADLKEWKKIYENGYTANGQRISWHYFVNVKKGTPIFGSKFKEIGEWSLPDANR